MLRLAILVGALAAPVHAATIDAPVWVEGVGFRHPLDPPVSREASDFWGRCLVLGDVMTDSKLDRTRTCDEVPEEIKVCETDRQCSLRCPEVVPGRLDVLRLDWPSTRDRGVPGVPEGNPAPVPLPSSLLLLLGALFLVAAVRMTAWLQGGHEACRSMTLAQALFHQDDARPEWRAYARETLRRKIVGRPRLHFQQNRA